MIPDERINEILGTLSRRDKVPVNSLTDFSLDSRITFSPCRTASCTQRQRNLYLARPHSRHCS